MKDYKEKFMLLFQAAHMEAVGRFSRENSRARRYNSAAFRDADFIIFRALTNSTVSNGVRSIGTSITFTGVSDTSVSLISVESLTSEERNILDSDVKEADKDSTILFNTVRVDYAKKMMDS